MLLQEKFRQPPIPSLRMSSSFSAESYGIRSFQPAPTIRFYIAGRYILPQTIYTRPSRFVLIRPLFWTQHTPLQFGSNVELAERMRTFSKKPKIVCDEAVRLKESMRSDWNQVCILKVRGPHFSTVTIHDDHFRAPRWKKRCGINSRSMQIFGMIC